MIRVGQILEVQIGQQYPKFQPVQRRHTKTGTQFEEQFASMLDVELEKLKRKEDK